LNELEQAAVSGKNNKPKVNRWDHRERKARGDANLDTIHLAVGRALSSWEVAQSFVVNLICVVTQTTSNHMYRAIGTQMDVIKKLDMLREAASAIAKQPELHKELKDLINLFQQFNERRNEIAHGVSMTTIDAGCFLIPGFATSKKRKKVSEFMDGADYYLTSDDINYFAIEFDKLSAKTLDLMGKLQGIHFEESTTSESH